MTTVLTKTKTNMHLQLISGLRHSVNEICSLLVFEQHRFVVRYQSFGTSQRSLQRSSNPILLGLVGSRLTIQRCLKSHTSIDLVYLQVSSSTGMILKQATEDPE